MSQPSGPRVEPSEIPELKAILRRGWLSKVRIFEVWCQNGDRLVQVVRVQGRPLALTQAPARPLHSSWAPLNRRGAGRRHSSGAPAFYDHRSFYEAAWLDLSSDAYYVRDGQPDGSIVMLPLQLDAQCQHETLPVPLVWLREQMETGLSKRVITRAEMGVRPYGE